MEAPATDDEAATDDELPALVDGISDEDGSSNEDEPVLVGTATSLAAHVLPRGYSDFFITRTTADEFSCASRQDVMAATFALRNLTLETQSCGKLHVHTWMAVPRGIFYVNRSRVQNIAFVDVHAYVANYVTKGQRSRDNLFQFAQQKLPKGTHHLNLAGDHLKITGVPFAVIDNANANTSTMSFM